MKNWSKASFSELIEYLEKHHSALKEKFNELSLLLARVSGRHEDEYSSTVESLRDFFIEFQPEMESHFDKEERILLPYIRQMDSFSKTGTDKPEFHYGSIKNPISLMECEHDRVENVMLNIMRTITSNYKLPPDAVDDFKHIYDLMQSLETEISEHIYLENKILFPQVIQLELLLMHSR